LSGLNNTVHVLFEIITTQSANKIGRPPFELSIVLDRSGSMDGCALESCKTATEKILDNLAAQDVVHFVTYDDKADVVFSDGNAALKECLVPLVRNVKAGGCTNLLEGIETGFKQIHLDTNCQKRIFLFSDGLVNKGESKHTVIQTKVAEFHAAGVHTSSLGIGTDYDETLMRNIAEYGRGDYFFINSNTEIERIIDNAISGLISTVGTNALLCVRGCNGALLKKIYHHQDLVKGAQLGDLKEDDTKQIVAEFEFGPTADGTQVLAEWSLTWTTKSAEEGVQAHEITGQVCIVVTDDRSRAGLVPDKVQVALCVAQTADHDLQVLRLLDDGNIEKAISLQRAHLERLKELQTTLQDENGFFQFTVLAAEQSLEKLLTRNTQAARKHVGYSNYLNCGQSKYEAASYFL